MRDRDANNSTIWPKKGKGYPTPTLKEKRNARLSQIVKFPIYLLGLFCALRHIVGSFGNSTEQMDGANWQILIAFCTIVAVKFARPELIVAVFKLHKFTHRLKITPEHWIPTFLLLPIICIALVCIYLIVSPLPALLIISSLLAIPLFSVLAFGSYHGIVDPFWPASFKKSLKQGNLN